MSVKNSIDTMGNRTRDLPTCSTVPQPNALPRAPSVNVTTTKLKYELNKAKSNRHGLTAVVCILNTHIVLCTEN